MTVYFDNAGMQAEVLCAKQFKGELTKAKEHQFKDIDLFIQGKSVSVKDQLYSSKRFGSVQVELELKSTEKNKTMQGCFYSNESDYYIWRVHTPEKGDSWVSIASEKLKRWVQDNKHSLRKWSTTASTEAKNRSYGRVFDGSSGLVIPLAELINLGRVIKVRGGVSV